MPPQTPISLDYRSPSGPSMSGRYTIALFALSLLPYPVLAISLLLEWIDYFGPGISFYPGVFILFLFLSTPLEAATLLVSVRALRQGQAFSPSHVRAARWTVAVSIVSLGSVSGARAFLFLVGII